MLYTWRKVYQLDLLIGLFLFGLALWLRSFDLTHFVTADEHNWIFRSGLFLNAVLRRDWPGTSVWLTPGVTTTWLGSLSLAAFYRIHELSVNEPFLEWLVSFPRNKIDLDVLVALRWSMALSTSFMIVVIYGLALKLWARSVALLGTLLLLAEPHLLAVSRIIGHDALITFFAIVSLLAFFYARRSLPLPVTSSQQTMLRRVVSYRWFILSGLFAGLAVLSKAPALILVPFVGLIFLVDLWQNKETLSRWLWALLIWFGAAWATFILVWPAAWAAPLGQTWAVINNAFLSSAGLEDADIQVYWSIPDLGSLYYLINGSYKVSPLLMLGTILAGFAGWLQIRRRKLVLPDLANIDLVWLVLFAVLFGLMMTFGVKKSPRYILPAFPALVFVAAWGWLFVLRRVSKPVAILTLGSLGILFTLTYAPYYFTYFNPLIGGAITAPRVVRIGWGEGLDELGRWLDARPDAGADRVGSLYTSTLYPYYRGHISSPISHELDYVAFYIKQSQSGYPTPEILAYFDQLKPLHRVVLNGIEYVKVFEGPGMVPVELENNGNLPIAFRPHTIYAPIGGALTIDLLWPADPGGGTVGHPVKLKLKSVDAALMVESEAIVLEMTLGVRVSQHTFELPEGLTRDRYLLLVDQNLIGEIKARIMDTPSDFEPMSIDMAGQLRLAGIRQRIGDDRLMVDLAWQGWPEATNDYTVFVQLIDENQQRISGVDVSPARGFTTLDRKEIMLTSYEIPLPDDLQPAAYSLLVGLYYFAGDDLIQVGATQLESPIYLD
jgi:hypothetical protein